MSGQLSVKTPDSIYFSEEHEMLRRTVRDFVNKELNPNIEEWEETTAPLHDIFKKMGKLGLLGIRYDQKYGGQELDYWYETVMLEELGHIKGMGVAMGIAVQTNMSTPAISEFGSEYLKETYLKPAVMGDVVTIPVALPNISATSRIVRSRSPFGNIPTIPLLVRYPVARAVAAAEESVTSEFKEKVSISPK